MKPGKLPISLLRRLLEEATPTDPRVLLGPRVGEDAALLDMGDRVLVATTDPITFATDLIGWYAVQVNANDVATYGAAPRWFMATLLLPEGATEELAQSIFHQMVEACRALEVSLVGGHSEVTYGLDRPILVGTMLGEVEPDRLVQTSGALPGDALLLTKGIAIEGTALLAWEAADRLRAAGMDDDTLQRAREYLFSPGISVVKDALIACQAAPVHAMHDPTEGGLATALHEMAEAAGVGLRVDLGCISVLPECARLCQALELDPLGLLASGALLIALPVDSVPPVVEALAAQGVDAQVIGSVVEQGEGLKLSGAQGTTPLPLFERDEVARVVGSP